jgi:2-keto-4-pentenoate hydratase
VTTEAPSDSPAEISFNMDKPHFMDKTDIPRLAQRQLADYDAHHPGLVFEQDAGLLSIADAYTLQIEVAQLRQARGEELAGYKIGCLSPAVRLQLGLDEAVFGHVHATEVYSDRTTLDAATFDGLAIEGEFAVRLSADIPDPASLEQAPREFVESVFPVIELHNYVFRGSSPTAPELIGNNALNAGAVIGNVEPALLEPDQLLAETISVRINDELVGAADAGAISGGPLASLVHLVKRLHSFGIHPRKGQILLTGSPLPLFPVRAGDHIQVQCPNLGSVETRVK